MQENLLYLAQLTLKDKNYEQKHFESFHKVFYILECFHPSLFVHNAKNAFEKNLPQYPSINFHQPFSNF